VPGVKGGHHCDERQMSRQLVRPNLVGQGRVSRLTWFIVPAEDEAADRSEGHRRAMDDTDTRAAPEREDRGVGEAFDLVASKLLRPPVRPGTVRRSALLERLANGDARRLVSVPRRARRPALAGLVVPAVAGGHAGCGRRRRENAGHADLTPRPRLAAADFVEPGPFGLMVFCRRVGPGVERRRRAQ
jgi:hypothetical protein